MKKDYNSLLVPAEHSNPLAIENILQFHFIIKARRSLSADVQVKSAEYVVGSTIPVDDTSCRDKSIWSRL